MQDSISAKDFYLMTKVNRVIIPFATFLAGMIVSNNFQIELILPAFVSIAFVYAGAAILNDIFDKDIDEISNPERPIPAKKISFTGAVFLIGIFTFVGLLAGYWFSSITGNYLFLWLMVIEFVLGIIYSSFTSKNFILANGTLAFSHGLIPFLAATQLVSGLTPKNMVFGGTIWVILFFTYNLKDLKDADGDKFERSTLPGILGLEKAKKLNQLFLIATIPVAIIVYFVAQTSIVSLALTMLFGLMLAVLSLTLKKAKNKNDFVFVLNWYRIGMALFLISLVL
jgi:4-hydroxybenzoate polyprenyltransferase